MSDGKGATEALAEVQPNWAGLGPCASSLTQTLRRTSQSFRLSVLSRAIAPTPVIPMNPRRNSILTMSTRIYSRRCASNVATTFRNPETASHVATLRMHAQRQ